VRSFYFVLYITNTSIGYKLRKHIATALRARSQAIRNSLDRYNTAASALSPARPNLSWDDVVEYAFLADFDLLRDSRQDIRDRPWSRPAFRIMIDQYFKLERAREEIQRLNVEIPRVITYVRDEDAFLQLKVSEIREANPGLACQVEKHRLERGRYNEKHMSRFCKLASMSGFTGSIQPGISVDADEGVPAGMEIDIEYKAVDDGEESEEDDEEDEDIRNIVATVLSLTLD
jgi:hypothetical protein